MVVLSESPNQTVEIESQESDDVKVKLEPVRSPGVTNEYPNVDLSSSSEDVKIKKEECDGVDGDGDAAGVAAGTGGGDDATDDGDVNMLDASKTESDIDMEKCTKIERSQELEDDDDFDDDEEYKNAHSESEYDGIYDETHDGEPELIELLDLLDQVEDYIPTVPDSLSLRYLEEAGFDEVDPRITRLMSIASQKFISEIANDALQHCKTRTINSQHSSGHNSNKDKKPNKDKKYTLTVEDLQPALAENGITVRKPQYFV